MSPRLARVALNDGSGEPPCRIVASGSASALRWTQEPQFNHLNQGAQPTNASNASDILGMMNPKTVAKLDLYQGTQKQMTLLVVPVGTAANLRTRFPRGTRKDGWV